MAACCGSRASGTLQILIGTASWVGLVRILSTFGSAALAGYTIAIRIVLFALLPSWGISNAAATMVGQNLGAGQPGARRAGGVARRALQRRSSWAASAVVFVAVRRPHRRRVHPDPAVAPYGMACLRIVSAGFLFYAYGMVMTQSFNGAGRHVDADDHQPLRLLAVGDSARLAARQAARLRPARRVRGGAGRLLHAGGGERGGVPPGPLEARPGVTSAP